MPATKAPTKGRSPKTNDKLFSDEERAAAQETVRERKRATARQTPEEERAGGEADIEAKIAEMPEADQVLARRIHQIVLETAPDLMPRTYYGMPAYAKDGKIICFFQAKSKFKVRYATFGFQHDAKLDDGNMWPVAFALTELTSADESKIASLVKKAAR